MTGVTMATLDRPKPKRGNGAAHAAVLVSGYELARHFGCSRQNVDLLAQQGVIERRSDGKFDQDQSRLKYLTHLRSENRRSPRSEADAAHVAAKTEMLQLRLMEKRRDLMRTAEVHEMVDDMIGTVLTALSGLPVRVAGRDLVQRRRAEAVVFELRTELANEFQRRADEYGELDE
jgi:hypothetical protein